MTRILEAAGRTGARAIALSVAAICLSTIPVLPAGAFTGDAAVVRKAVLTREEIRSALQGRDIPVDQVFGSGYTWQRSTVRMTLSTTVTQPEMVELDVGESAAERDGYFAYLKARPEGELKVVKKTSDTLTLDGVTHLLIERNGEIVDTGPRQVTRTWKSAGSDGLVQAECVAAAEDIAVALPDRMLCSESLASAQARKWERTAPTYRYATTRSVVRHIPATAAVRAAPSRNVARLSSGAASTFSARYEGRGVQKPYLAYWKKNTKRQVAPVKITVIQYGNPLNAVNAFAANRRSTDASGAVIGTRSTSFGYVRRSKSVYTGVATMRIGSGVYTAKCQGTGAGASTRVFDCARGLLPILVKAQNPIVIR